MKRLCKLLFSRYFICTVFIILEIALLAPSFWLSDYPQLLLVFSIPLTVAAIVELINRNINPDNKLTWMLVLVFLPYVGVVIYAIFSKRRISRKEACIFSRLTPIIAQRKRNSNSGEVIDKLDRENPLVATKVRAIINDDYLAELSDGSASEYFSSGEQMYSAMKRELLAARDFIFLEYFIIEPGVMLDGILEILAERASAGVEVRILYDDVGCMGRLDAKFEGRLASFGIKCARFSPITPIATAVHNNRDHRKLMIIDGDRAFTGGVNIADEYINMRERFGHWKDGGILIRGSAVRCMCELFLTMWDMTKREISDYERFTQKEMSGNISDGGYYLPFGSGPLPIYRRPVGKNAFLNIINQAQSYVYITTPYLVIDYDLTEALRNAALRGVDVRIITPRVADKKSVKIMTKSSYLNLMDAGVGIYEYTPGFIHEKLVVSDDLCAVVGTINFDYRSLVHHFENAVFMALCPTVIKIKEEFINTEAKCERIDASAAKLGFFEWLLKILIRAFAPIM